MKKLVIKNESDELQIIRDLSLEELKQYEMHIEKINSFEQDFSLYFITTLNYYDLQQAIKEHSISIINTDDRSIARAIMMDLNRRLINYMTSARSFVDHMETILKRKFGESSAEYITFKSATSKEFDDYFAYRFFYKLRNYAQHCGMPISRIHGKYNYDTETKSTSDETVMILFSRDSLLRNYSEWGKIVKKDLINMEEDILINPYLEEFHQSLIRINGVIMSSKLEKLQESIAFFEAFFSKVKDWNCPIYIGNLVGEKDGHFSFEEIPMPIIKVVIDSFKEEETIQA